MDKQTALEAALVQIEKQFGKGSVMKLGDAAATQISVIPTGSIQIDAALGVGGIPRGRIIEIFGPESSGKTTIALQMVASAQKLGGIAAYIDAEHAMDPNMQRLLGVDVDNLYISQPDTGEQGWKYANLFVRSGAIDIVVIDSVAALVPRQRSKAIWAALIWACRRAFVAGTAQAGRCHSKTNATAIFINQLREKVGVMFGNPEVTTGGKALKFYATVRMDIRKGDA